MKNTIGVFAVLATAILSIAGTIDLDNLLNYANQTVPNYITQDNTPVDNAITDEGATLGRVLFYDKNLSANGTIACASCHQQAFAFGDTATQSVGLTSGLTGRHSMRLVNARFAEEEAFFWDERASSLEFQTTQPIQDHVEMGFSGDNGDPDIDSLIRKLEQIDYYEPLFTEAFGDAEITEDRMQKALAQFVRSIQSFDSKYDEGLALVINGNQDFPNFTASENAGKRLFLDAPLVGGAGCGGCHRAPEFDIDPNSLNNGIVGEAGVTNGLDLTNTRSPSLRDLMNPNGTLNGPLMHTGEFTTLYDVIEHYNAIPQNADNTNLDPRLGGGPGPGGMTQNLQLTEQEKEDLIAFLGTLTGEDMYTNEKWSDPFDANGDLTILGWDVTAVSSLEKENIQIQVYPNPVVDQFTIDGLGSVAQVELLGLSGQIYKTVYPTSDLITMNVFDLPSGIFFVRALDKDGKIMQVEKVIKR